MTKPHVLVVAVDGLRASALGAYGNTTFATPELDQFAAESFLLDHSYALSPELPDAYRALWHSAHPLRPGQTHGIDRSLPRQLAARGYETILVSDEVDQFAAQMGKCFDQCVEIAVTGSESRARARSISQTGLARLFAAACEVIQAQCGRQTARDGVTDSPSLIWVHSRGMYGPWDAPPELQEALLDEEDPPPLDDIASPDLDLTQSDDPDSAFRYSCAYAAQIMVLDTCWAALMETVAAASQASSWLVVLTGVRGFPLGEHQHIGGVDPRLYGEQLHVPWIVRFPDHQGALVRSHALTSHVDLLPTILDFIDEGSGMETTGLDGVSILPLVAAEHVTWRDWLLATCPAGSQAIRTANWCLRQDAVTSPLPVPHRDRERGSEVPSSELYVRPDDRWEANDVAKLCPEVVEQLTGAIGQHWQQIAAGRPMPAPISPTVVSN